jgi:ABC-type multidrug transport system ATPase subunit
VCKTFPCSQGLKKALTNFSLKIEKGKIFGLLGPNGAGKTTFLSIITGIMNADEGSGVICGHSIDDIGSHTGEIGFCPQFDILWPALNVTEHLIFMSMFKGMTKEESENMAKRLIKDVDLEEDFHKMAK